MTTDGFYNQLIVMLFIFLYATLDAHYPTGEFELLDII